MNIDQQIKELKAAGWKEYRTGIWVAPNGVLYRGPHGAWKVMQWLSSGDSKTTPANPTSPSPEATHE